MSDNGSPHSDDPLFEVNAGGDPTLIGRRRSFDSFGGSTPSIIEPRGEGHADPEMGMSSPIQSSAQTTALDIRADFSKGVVKVSYYSFSPSCEATQAEKF